MGYFSSNTVNTTYRNSNNRISRTVSNTDTNGTRDCTITTNVDGDDEEIDCSEKNTSNEKNSKSKNSFKKGFLNVLKAIGIIIGTILLVALVVFLGFRLKKYRI